MQNHTHAPGQTRCHNTALCVQNLAHKDAMKRSRCKTASWLSLCAGLSRVPGSRVHALRCERAGDARRACLRGRAPGTAAERRNKRLNNVCGRPAGAIPSVLSRAGGPLLVALGVALALHGPSKEPLPDADVANGRACIMQPSMVMRLLAVGGKVHPKRSAKVSGPSARL